jgi:hypothetical protein
MDFETIRPFLSGLIGASIAGWIAVKLAGRIPHAKNTSKQRALVDKDRRTLRYANFGAGIGLGLGFMFYFGGFLDRHDWRGVGLGGGLMGFLPLLIIVCRNLRGGMQGIKNGFLAFELATKTPALLLVLFMGIMSLVGLWAAIAFIPKTTKAEQDAPLQPLPPALFR